MKHILDELVALEPLRQSLRQDALIYQAEEKRRIAKLNGVPIDSYYFVQYDVWAAIQYLANKTA